MSVSWRVLLKKLILTNLLAAALVHLTVSILFELLIVLCLLLLMFNSPPLHVHR